MLILSRTTSVIDYDLLLLMAPMELAGAVFGVTVQRVLPDWLFLSFAVVVLGFTCYKTYKKVCNFFLRFECLFG